jgi:hypothetical protein
VSPSCAEVRAAEIQEELRSPGLQVHRLFEHRDGLVVTLGPAVEEAELHAGVDRAGIDAEDALELDPGIVITAPVHQAGRQEVAGPHIIRLQQHGSPERLSGLAPELLLVVDGAELHPQAGVPGGDLGQRLDLVLSLREAAEPDQEIAQSLDEGGVVRVRSYRLPVRFDGLVRLPLGLVGVAQGRPGSVVIGIELDGPGQARDGLIELLGLDRQAAQQKVSLGQARLTLDQAHQHRASPIVLFLLDVVAREGEIRLFGVGAQRDDSFELGLSLRVFALPPVELGEGEVGARVVGGQLHRFARGRHGLLGRFHSRQPLGLLAPQERGALVALDRLLHRRHCFLEPAGLRVHLRDRVVVVGLGGRGHRRRRPPRSRAVGLGDHLPHAGAAGEDAGQEEGGGEQTCRRRLARPGHQSAGGRAQLLVGDGRHGSVDLAHLVPAEGPCPGRARGGPGGSRRRYRAQAHAQGPDLGKASGEAGGQLGRAQGQLMKPGRVVGSDLQTAIDQTHGPGVPGPLRACDLGPGPTDPLHGEGRFEPGDGARQQFGNGPWPRRFHRPLSYPCLA